MLHNIGIYNLLIITLATQKYFQKAFSTGNIACLATPVRQWIQTFREKDKI